MLKVLGEIGLVTSIAFASIVLAPMVAMAQPTTAAAQEIRCIKTVDREHLQGAAFRNAIEACEPRPELANEKAEEKHGAALQKKITKASNTVTRLATKRFDASCALKAYCVLKQL